MSIATSKMRGPHAWETTPCRCAMVMVWDPSCWWIDGVLMLSAFGGECESFVVVSMFFCFFSQGFSTQNWQAQRKTGVNYTT